MTVTVQAPGRIVSATVHHRKSVTKLDAGQLADLRRAFKAAMDIKPLDNRSYQYFAGWHGVPQGWCQHHNVFFLPWHRQYLYYFELALQHQVPGVSLAWWDWTVDRDIPPAYGQRRVGNATNPLYQSAIKVSPREGTGRGGPRERPGPFPSSQT